MNVKIFTKSRLIVILLMIVVAAGGYLFLAHTPASAQDQPANGNTTASTLGTVTVQPADLVVGEVSAAGTIDLASQQYVALKVDGVIKSMAVKAGDQVKAGDVLLSLDTEELERAVYRAELAMQVQQNALDQLTEEASAAYIAVAQASLAEAQENLAEVQVGPSDEEIAAARSSLAAAWAKYNELVAGPSDAELTQLSADLKKSEIALADAQRAYDQIAWRSDVGMSSQASDLQDATIDYESALAAYTEATAPAATSDLQSALSSAQDAQSTLDDLLNSPTAAEVATAQAQVADAQSTLDDLLAGADATDLADARLALEQALVDLQEAYADLAAAKVTAPIDGTVLALDAEVGERVGSGTVVATLADPGQLELTISVAEMDVVQVEAGQAATIEIDAFPGRTFTGIVAYIAPASDESSGVVYYPVTVRLTGESLDGVLPGMSAVATLTNDASTTSSGWLVPTNAIQTQGDSSLVTVVRNGATIPIQVTPGTVQGEWTVVESENLQEGDAVVGSVTSHIDDTTQNSGPGGPPPDGGMMMPPGG